MMLSNEDFWAKYLKEYRESRLWWHSLSLQTRERSCQQAVEQFLGSKENNTTKSSVTR